MGRLVDWKRGIIRGLAFFSCGCNQLKSFHIHNKDTKKIKRNGIPKLLYISNMPENFFKITFMSVH